MHLAARLLAEWKRGIVLCVFLPASLALGQSKDSSAPAPFTTSGFIDAFYSYNFDKPVTRMNQLRNFDVNEHQFDLSLAEIVLQKAASPIGFRMDIDFGTTNDMVQPGNTSTLSHLQQAYLTGVVPIGNGLTVDAGKFVTHMGYEVIESKDNWNYSRSFLFSWAIPYYHTGLRLTYPFASVFTAALHIVNGWNGGTPTMADNNNSQSVGLQLNFTPSSSTSLLFNVMMGHENLTPIEYGARNVYDLVFTQTVSDAFSFGLNGDYGEARTSLGLAVWKGADIYGRYACGARSAVSVRAEVFSDPQGYATQTVKQDLKEITATYEYKPSDPLILRAEYRYDASTAAVFDGASGPASRRNQSTVALAAIVVF